VTTKMKPPPKGLIYTCTSNQISIDNAYQYGELFWISKDEVGFPSLENPTKGQREEIDAVRNIRRSYLHNHATRLGIFPYSYMIQWIFGHTNVNTKKIINYQGICIASFMSSDLEVCYKFPHPEQYLTNQWVGEFARIKDYHEIISEWYEEGKTFKTKTSKVYPTINFKAPIMYAT